MRGKGLRIDAGDSRISGLTEEDWEGFHVEIVGSLRKDKKEN
jgi:hypothetical protein